MRKKHCNRRPPSHTFHAIRTNHHPNSRTQQRAASRAPTNHPQNSTNHQLESSAHNSRISRLLRQARRIQLRVLGPTRQTRSIIPYLTSVGFPTRYNSSTLLPQYPRQGHQPPFSASHTKFRHLPSIRRQVTRSFRTKLRNDPHFDDRSQLLTTQSRIVRRRPRTTLQTQARLPWHPRRIVNTIRQFRSGHLSARVIAPRLLSRFNIISAFRPSPTNPYGLNPRAISMGEAKNQSLEA